MLLSFQSRPGHITSSRIALFEARATFRRKESEGILLPGSSDLLYQQLQQDIASGQIRLVELSADLEKEFGQVLVLCSKQSPLIPIRTLDTLHLAAGRIADESEIAATDKRLRDAAKLLGFSLFPVCSSVRLPSASASIPHPQSRNRGCHSLPRTPHSPAPLFVIGNSSFIINSPAPVFAIGYRLFIAHSASRLSASCFLPISVFSFSAFQFFPLSHCLCVPVLCG